MATAVGTAAVIAYAVSRWSDMASWGATEAEAMAILPGDELLVHANYRSTHAITINVSAAEVWPWLVQMGGRLT